MSNQKTMIDKTTADKIWDVLVTEAGASEYMRYQFVSYFTRQRSGEYRFQGDFGFGGKFYFDIREWRVGYYREDEKPGWPEKADSVNVRLVMMRMIMGLPISIPANFMMRK